MEENVRYVSGITADEIWSKLAADFQGQDVMEYNAVLQQKGLPPVNLYIEIDLGGGFEGGYEQTLFSAPVDVADNFRFALHHAGFLDKAGKLLGMEDKQIGFDEFDKEFIIKTNDESKAKAAFSDAWLRDFFQALQSFNLHIAHHDKGSFLELEIEAGINDLTELRTIYDAFTKVLQQLQAT